MVATASHYENVSPNGRLRILIEQTGMNQANNTSTVRVRGMMYNDSDHRSYHDPSNVSRSISGTDSLNPPDFSFSIAAHDSYTFIDHSFVVHHNSDRRFTVFYTVHYGNTGTDIFGNGKSSEAELVLTRIPGSPAPPGQPQFSSVQMDSVRVSWTASPDNMGSAIDTYSLRMSWTVKGQTYTSTDIGANNLARNVTGLVPGRIYEFAVRAHNKSTNNDGWSDWSQENQVQLPAGVWLRMGLDSEARGVWHEAIPYARDNGEWKVAVPYVRDDGTWKLTS